MKKVTQPSDTGFIVSNKSVEAPVIAALVEEPADEKVSKRASKKAEAAKEEVAAESEVAEEEPAVEAE